MIIVKEKENEEKLKKSRERDEEIRKMKKDFEKKVAFDRLSVRNSLLDGSWTKLPIV